MERAAGKELGFEEMAVEMKAWRELTGMGKKEDEDFGGVWWGGDEVEASGGS